MADKKNIILDGQTDEQIADRLIGDKDGWTLDELINQMCPDGVEWKKLGSMGAFYGGLTGKSKPDFSDKPKDGYMPFVPYINVFNNRFVDYSHLGYVRVGENEHQHEIHQGDFLFTLSSETKEETGMVSAVISEPDTVTYLNSFCSGWRPSNADILEPRFLGHVLRSRLIRRSIVRCAHGVTRFNISKPMFAEVMVPVPPIEVQVRIAHILDLLSELTSELTSERNARQQQYEWYRNHLLDKDTLTGGEGGGWQTLADLIDATCPDGVEYKPIANLVCLNAHKQLGASALEALISDEGDIPLLPSSKNYDWRTTEELAGDAVCEGNVIAMGRARYANMKYCSGKFVSANNILIESADEDTLNTRFLYHFLSTHSADCYAESGTYPKFDRVLFEKLRVPVPPIEVQALIVDLLDRLDDYASKVDAVLPKEIIASQQRYEWWRDRLLDFHDVRGGGGYR